jgi:hypothetical protein
MWRQLAQPAHIPCPVPRLKVGRQVHLSEQ